MSTWTAFKAGNWSDYTVWNDFYNATKTGTNELTVAATDLSSWNGLVVYLITDAGIATVTNAVFGTDTVLTLDVDPSGDQSICLAARPAAGDVAQTGYDLTIDMDTAPINQFATTAAVTVTGVGVFALNVDSNVVAFSGTTFNAVNFQNGMSSLQMLGGGSVYYIDCSFSSLVTFQDTSGAYTLYCNTAVPEVVGGLTVYAPAITNLVPSSAATIHGYNGGICYVESLMLYAGYSVYGEFTLKVIGADDAGAELNGTIRLLNDTTIQSAIKGTIIVPPNKTLTVVSNAASTGEIKLERNATYYDGRQYVRGVFNAAGVSSFHVGL